MLWVVITCDVPYEMYGVKHSSVTEYIQTRIDPSHVIGATE